MFIAKGIQINDWRLYLSDGRKYLRTAVAGARNRPKVFGPEIVYNLTLIAIEKQIMGYLMSRGDLAENHTMTDLAAALEQHVGPLPELRQKLQFLDTFQEMCDLDTYSRQTPTWTEIATTLAIGAEIEQFITATISE